MTAQLLQPVNYSAHAIDDLRRTEAEIRDVAPESARALLKLTDMLRDSVKFMLPNCCDLIDPEDLKQAHLDLLRLPYPLVTFEAPWEREPGPDFLGEFQQWPATKRIALCWEASPVYEVVPGLNTVLEKFTQGGVFVVPIYWGASFGQWSVSMGGVFVPYDNEMRTTAVGEILPASDIAQRALAELGVLKNADKEFSAEPFILLPELFAHAVQTHGTVEKAFAQILLDTHDEIQMLIQACCVINCANVTTADIAASEALNKKRRLNDKQPFFSYKILQLSDERRSGIGTQKGDSHTSPRMHLRRGHLRRLEEKTIWVRPAMVNANAGHGVVAKDYAVTAKPESRRRTS